MVFNYFFSLLSTNNTTICYVVVVCFEQRLIPKSIPIILLHIFLVDEISADYGLVIDNLFS